MSFPWLDCTPPRPGGHTRRTEVARAELASRAGLLYRLGFSQAATTARLAAEVAWEFDPPSKHGAHTRPDGLSDPAIATLVAEAYARSTAAGSPGPRRG